MAKKSQQAVRVDDSQDLALRNEELLDRGALREFRPKSSIATSNTSLGVFEESQRGNLVVIEQKKRAKKKKVEGIAGFFKATGLKLNKNIEDITDDELDELEKVVSGLSMDSSMKHGSLSPEQEQVLRQSSLFEERSVDEAIESINALLQYEQQKQAQTPEQDQRLQIFDSGFEAMIDELKNPKLERNHSTTMFKALEQDREKLEAFEANIKSARAKFLEYEKKGRELEAAGSLDEAQTYYNQAHTIVINTQTNLQSLKNLYYIEDKLDKEIHIAGNTIKSSVKSAAYYRDQKGVLSWVTGHNKFYEKSARQEEELAAHMKARQKDQWREKDEALKFRQQFLDQLAKDSNLVCSNQAFDGESKLSQGLKTALHLNARGYLPEDYWEDYQEVHKAYDVADRNAEIVIAVAKTTRNVCIIAGATVATGGAGLVVGVAAGTAVGTVAYAAENTTHVAVGTKDVETALKDTGKGAVESFKTSAVTAVATVTGAGIADKVSKCKTLLKLAGEGTKMHKAVSVIAAGSAAGSTSAAISTTVNYAVEYPAAVHEFQQTVAGRNLSDEQTQELFVEFMQERGLTLEQMLKHGFINVSTGAISGLVGSSGNAIKMQLNSKLLKTAVSTLEASADSIIGYQSAELHAQIDGRDGASMEEIVNEIGMAAGGTAMGEVSNYMLQKQVATQKQQAEAALGSKLVEVEGAKTETATKTEKNVLTEQMKADLDLVTKKAEEKIIEKKALDQKTVDTVKKAGKNTLNKTVDHAEVVLKAEPDLTHDQALKRAADHVMDAEIHTLLHTEVKVPELYEKAVYKSMHSTGKMALKIRQQDGVSTYQAVKRAKAIKRAITENGQMAKQVEQHLERNLGKKARVKLRDEFVQSLEQEADIRLKKEIEETKSKLGKKMLNEAKKKAKQESKSKAEEEAKLKKAKKKVVEESKKKLADEAKKKFDEGWIKAARKGIRMAFRRMTASGNLPFPAGFGDGSSFGNGDEYQRRFYVLDGIDLNLDCTNLEDSYKKSHPLDGIDVKFYKVMRHDPFRGKTYLCTYRNVEGRIELDSEVELEVTAKK